MKSEFDTRLRAQESKIRVGSRVLLKLKKTENTPAWDPVPFVVTSISGSMVTASKDGRLVTRNSSFFKLTSLVFDSDSEDEDGADAVASQSNVQNEAEEDTPTNTDTHITGEAPVQAKPTDNQPQARPAGRPTKEESEQIKLARQADLEAKSAKQTPVRRSARLAKTKKA